ncbi:MAG: thioesterase family protein [Moraxellaceae bacterium]|nr:thioesterase family protein [Moraxellaceae bacterium]MDP1776939.1 thioesterase family protein [Moraxellaceae bacterium]
MSKDFQHLLRVRYAECDGQNVVFNGRYVDYIDVAMKEFMRVVWGSYQDVHASGIDIQAVGLSFNWKAPVHFDDVLVISIKSARIGNTSYTLALNFHKHATQAHVASAEITYVMVSAGNHKKMTIPQTMREQLEHGAPGVVVNHAGV